MVEQVSGLRFGKLRNKRKQVVFEIFRGQAPLSRFNENLKNIQLFQYEKQKQKYNNEISEK